MSVECPINKLAIQNGHTGCNNECLVDECLFSGDGNNIFPINIIEFKTSNQFVARNLGDCRVVIYPDIPESA